MHTSQRLEGCRTSIHTACKGVVLVKPVMSTGSEQHVVMIKIGYYYHDITYQNCTVRVIISVSTTTGQIHNEPDACRVATYFVLSVNNGYK